MTTLPCGGDRLRRLCEGNGTVLVGGAYDGMTGRLVAKAGFEAIWGSGFSISASKGIPDRNILQAYELVEKAAELVRSVDVPVIIDCDEGYGSHTIELVESLQKVNVAGICIEDNAFPKKNSFLNEMDRKLVSAREFSQKLLRIKERTSGMMIIARTEALIAGFSLQEAVERGKVYVDSGADMVLIHSKFTSMEQFEKLIGSWNSPVPLVVVPTAAF